MSFADPMVLTVNAVAKNLTRINQDSNGSDYFYDGVTEKHSANVRHTIMPDGKFGESHMLRYDTSYYDGNSQYLRKGSVWIVAKSFDSAQNSTTLGYSLAAAIAYLTVGNQAKLLAREV